MSKRINYNEGDKLGELFYIKDTKFNKIRYALFKCRCGKEIETAICHAKSGDIKHCGCMPYIGRTTHNSHKTKEYRTWAAMIQRCYNEKTKKYYNYGGRGIKVSDDWRYSFENFIKDMGIRPSKNHSLDRIDVNGNYSAENCKWSDDKEQNRNKRTNVNLTLLGKTLCLTDWATLSGMSNNGIRRRLNKGFSLALTLTLPVKGKSMAVYENILKLHLESKKQPLPNYIRVEAAYN